MHESSIVENLLAVVLQHAQRANAGRVLEVNLVLGPTSHESDTALQFYWDQASPGTLAQGARLRFERAPEQLRCADCGCVFSFSADSIECPTCLSRRLRPVPGDSVRVDSIEVE